MAWGFYFVSADAVACVGDWFTRFSDLVWVDII